MCEEESVGLPTLHLLVRLSSFSEDQDRARVDLYSTSRGEGGRMGTGVRFRACESSRQGATATPTASLPTPFSRLPPLRPIRGVGAEGTTSDTVVAVGVSAHGGVGTLPARC